jgi:bifunctional non-homologous end joining protein LigD
VVCQDAATVLYLANLGCIELNPWLSSIGSLDYPDYLVIDLDPEAAPFSRVIEVAVALHRMLDRAGVECLCKTSGKRGLHVVLLLGARYDYEQARQFAEVVANLVQERLPAATSVLRSPALHRGGCTWISCRTAAARRWRPPTPPGPTPERRFPPRWAGAR